ncbi:MAG: hypothetical protein CMN30_16925 [Sandaracinus sp.]|nr:hypothetical protein [Sandaracinus sp.]|tara:strand:- start:2438 stop:2782 length:345 start_codon:yes stop_codon:yes gene_type:complete
MRRLAFGALALGLFASGAAAQEDVGSQVDAICCGGNCCLIDGDCFTSGEANPADSCLSCDPSGSQTAWTNTCGSADAGTTPADDDDDDGCAAGGRAGYGAGLVGLALFFRRRRR